MNIKFCYKDEIHKTFLPPSTFNNLLEEIKSSFGDRLPSNFVLQYRDKDGDLITMSSDREYSSMLRFDAPRTMASVKVFIVPVEKTFEEGDTSFEVIEASQSLSEGCISEFSLSSRLNSKGTRSPSGSPLKEKELSFSDDGVGEQDTSPTLEGPIRLHSDSLNELYKTRATIVKECLNTSPVKSGTRGKGRFSTKTERAVRTVQPCLLLDEIDEPTLLAGCEDLKSATVRNEIDKFMARLSSKKVKKSSSNAQNQKTKAAQRIQRAFRALKSQRKSSKSVTNAIQKVFVECQADGPSSYVPVECQQALFFNSTESFGRQAPNNSSDNSMYLTEGSSLVASGKSLSRADLKYADYHLGGSSALQGNYSNVTEVYETEKKETEVYSYQAMVGMSSSILFITNDEGHGTTYKTIYLKNSGLKPWRKCLIKSVGILPGKVAEISNVEVGDVTLVTLELIGYFNVGIYSSQWSIIHEDEHGMMQTIGEPFQVDFIIEESNIMTTQGSVTSPTFQTYIPVSSEEKAVETLEEESEEDDDEDESEEETEQETQIGGPHSKEYLEYRDVITNKAKEMKKIFPSDTPDEIIRFVMDRPQLSFEDLTVAYLSMKNGL